MLEATNLSIEELLRDLREIYDVEIKARDLYAMWIRRFSDDSVVEALSKVKRDEEEHAQIASKLIHLVEDYKPEDLILKEDLKAFTETSALLLTLSLESYHKTNVAALKYLVNERSLGCLYIAVNKPSSTLIDTYRMEGVKVDALSFIDCSIVDVEGGRLTVRPENLMELSITISELLKRMPAPRYVHLDSISALYIFNPSDKVETFSHLMIRKLKAEKVGLILVTTKEEMDGKSLARLRSFCDREIER